MGILTGTLEAILVLIVLVLLTALALWWYWRRRFAALDQAYGRQHQAELARLSEEYEEQLQAALAALRQELDEQYQTDLAILRQESDKQHQADLTTLRQEFEWQHQSEIRDLVREFKHQASHCLRPIKDNLHQINRRMRAESVPEAPEWHQSLGRSLLEVDKYEWRLTRLIENLALVTRLESRDFVLHFSEVKLDVTVEELVFEFQDFATEEGISLACWSRSAPFPRIMANQDSLRQVFINLVDNAIKYCDEGDEVGVELEGKEAKNVVFARVSDTGPGIPEEDWDKIFERGYRVEDPRGLPPREVGQGLGLYIVKLAIEKHGGTINVTSELGKGTTFIITLPIRRF
jgi:two-component system phosphate regulon sensor histidine kinase PhoR